MRPRRSASLAQPAPSGCQDLKRGDLLLWSLLFYLNAVVLAVNVAFGCLAAYKGLWIMVGVHGFFGLLATALVCVAYSPHRDYVSRARKL